MVGSTLSSKANKATAVETKPKIWMTYSNSYRVPATITEQTSGFLVEEPVET